MYKKLFSKFSKKVMAGLVFGFMLAVGAALTIAFTEPTSAPTSMAEPTNANSIGSLMSEKNGSAGSLVADYTSYTLANGGVDDYDNNGTMPSDSYKSTWTACAAGNSYCGTSDSTNADMKDANTGLVWSKWLGSGATYTWFVANNCYPPGDVNNPGGVGGTCVNNGDDACQCVKRPSSQTGCEALGSGWRLPHQKELMQAYIDGSWGNLSNAGTLFWSATTTSNYTQGAWYVYLDDGTMNSYNKTGSTRSRCVR